MTNKFNFNFNFNDAVKELQAGKNLNGKGGVLTSIIKQLTKAALKAEIEQHLINDQHPNRKNGCTRNLWCQVFNF